MTSIFQLIFGILTESLSMKIVNDERKVVMQNVFIEWNVLSRDNREGRIEYLYVFSLSLSIIMVFLVDVMNLR